MKSHASVWTHTWWLSGILAVVAGALLATASCGDDAGENEPDDGGEDLTSRDIAPLELQTMTLTREDLGPQYADFEFLPSGFQTNDEAAQNPASREDELADAARFGRITSFASQYYSSAAAAQEVAGVVAVSSEIILFEDAPGAAANLSDSIGDVERDLRGITRSGLELGEFEVLDPAEVGEGSAGSVATITGGDPVRTSYSATIALVEGRIMGVVTLVSSGDDRRDEALTLARQLRNRILGVLRGEIDADASASRRTPRAGGERDEPLPREEFIDRISVLCDSAQEKVFPLQTELRVDYFDPEHFPDYGYSEYWRRSGDLISELLYGLRELRPPEEDQDFIQAWLDGLESALRLHDRLAAAALKDDVAWDAEKNQPPDDPPPEYGLLKPDYSYECSYLGFGPSAGR